MQFDENFSKHVEQYKLIIKKVAQITYNQSSNKLLQRILRKYPKNSGGLFSKSEVLYAYNQISKNEQLLSKSERKNFLRNIKMKRTRTVSGVTPVTVLTKPFPCPGKCIFCPNDVKMPKSYLSDEPGAQRAERNKFDPYLQTFNRLKAYKNIGHSTDKVELIILGGTWSSYPKEYQIWFVKRCFDAMNDFDPKVNIKSAHSNELKMDGIEMPYQNELLKDIQGDEINKRHTYNTVVSNALKSKQEMATFQELHLAHEQNESAKSRCVGLVIETRPDEITIEEAKHLRALGATKVQIGYQSLNDDVLKKNKRGHDLKQTMDATNILRRFGFKIHAHYMPNLYGSTPDLDVSDYKKLFKNKSLLPDEIKIYPCSLVQSAELMKYYRNGEWKPYNDKELLYVLTSCIMNTPYYCRITRVIRDICSHDIVVGNKKTNFRQIVESKLKKYQMIPLEIRTREIRSRKVSIVDLKLDIKKYETNVSDEFFLQYITKDNKLVGFLRLSLPIQYRGIIKELDGAAIIREIHVYGDSIEIGKSQKGSGQHTGIGKSLIQESKSIAKDNGRYIKLSVISSVGTREYYLNAGFRTENLYQHFYF